MSCYFDVSARPSESLQFCVHVLTKDQNKRSLKLALGASAFTVPAGLAQADVQSLERVAALTCESGV